MLEAVGFNVTVLEGGYRAYRSWIREVLDNLPKSFQLRVITGFTGELQKLSTLTLPSTGDSAKIFRSNMLCSTTNGLELLVFFKVSPQAPLAPCKLQGVTENF